MNHRNPTRISLAGALCLTLIGCQSLFGDADAADAADPSEVIAEVGGEEVSLAQLDDFVKQELLDQRTQGGSPARLHELRDAALDRLLQRLAIEQAAAARGVDVETLLTQVSEEMGPVDDQEISDFYAQNKARLPDVSFDELRPSIEAYLQQQRPQAATEKIADASGARRWLEPPRLDIDAVGPSMGPENARVTIVEFSDFQCPYCRRAGPVVKSLLERYPEDIRVVYRHLPLDFHDRARPAAEASACADEQGAFWPYHDLVFENPDALADEDLTRYASELGIDSEALGACLAAGRGRDVVEADLAVARAFGISGTPAFIVNGILMSGLQPEEAFVRVIDSELAGAAQ
jgi:protein-disulfide isomerase